MAKSKYQIKKSFENKTIYAKHFKGLGKDLTQEQLEELMQAYVLHKPASTHPYIDVVKGKVRAKRKEQKTPAPKPPINETKKQQQDASEGEEQ